jgi:peptide chain release factor 2
MAGAPGFWDDAEKAQKLMEERGQAERTVQTIGGLSRRLDDIATLIELGEEMGPADIMEELVRELAAVAAQLHDMEFRRMLSGEADPSNAIVSINSGAGGTESQDWAHMLLRMYLRYCERQGWKTEMLDYQDGEEAGIKGATFQVYGGYAFGWLKAESGVHRLVRISPFDSQARRHTSFASVYVTPEVDDRIEIEIREGDLRIDTYRASGAGGQHVNRTDSAVRITHIPTNIVVQCQAERSQIKNRDKAMKMLRSRLYEEELRKREEAARAVEAGKSDIAWGSQIRSYVLAPYQLVKDLRTQHESSDPQGVLDGALQPFIQAWLLQFGGGASDRDRDDAPL